MASEKEVKAHGLPLGTYGVGLATKSSEKSPRFALPHSHPGHEMKKIRAAATPSQSCSFNRFASNLPKLWETNVSLWFLTVENLFNLNGVSEKKRKYEFSLGALELRH